MKKPKRRVQKNHELRNEFVNKKIVTPPMLVPTRLMQRGYESAAFAAAERLARGLRLYER
ncbi:MAG TPA: hypothetical protein VIY48_08650 [Candidatus Paceibacterota bacterium]